MDRRRFLRIAVGSIIVVPAGRFLVQCASDDASASNPDDPAAAPALDGNEAIYTSSFSEAHFHTFSVEMSDFSSPPASGIDGMTSVTDEHSHGVTIPASMLTGVAAGSTTKVTTGSTSGHAHVLTLIMLSSSGADDAGPGGGGGGGGGGGEGGGTGGGTGGGYGGGGY
jgi:uncharacterized membrane protein YgcG